MVPTFLPPITYPSNILLTQARRGRDLGHFEDMNSPKSRDCSSCRIFCCVCVCVTARMHTHLHVFLPLLTALIPALNLRLIIISSSHHLMIYSYQHRQDSQCQHCLLSFQSKTHSILHYHTFRADVPKKRINQVLNIFYSKGVILEIIAINELIIMVVMMSQVIITLLL